MAATVRPRAGRAGRSRPSRLRPGVRWTFSPMPTSRDPRWGRGRGFGRRPLPIYPNPWRCASSTSWATEPSRAVATTTRRDDLRSVAQKYIFPRLRRVSIRCALTLGDLRSTRVDGIPRRQRLSAARCVLRKEWGFDGMVVTDWNSSGDDRPRLCHDSNRRIEQSVTAGRGIWI